MPIDLTALWAWLNAPGVLWALLLTHGPAILVVHFTKTLVCIIIPIHLLNVLQRHRGQPEFTSLCARPRKAGTFLYAWVVAALATDLLWPHTVPPPIAIPWLEWDLVNGIFSPVLVLAVIVLADRFAWLKPIADFLGSNEYDPQAAADELAKAQSPLKRVSTMLAQSQRGAKKVVLLADGVTKEVRDATVPSAEGERTMLDQTTPRGDPDAPPAQ